MPFSLFGNATGGQYPWFDFMGAPPDMTGEPQPPPSRGLSLPDLYQPIPPVQYPPAPPPIATSADLPEEQRKELRRRALILAAQAFGAPGGQIGSALAGAAAQSQAGREEAIERARQQQQQDYLLQRQEAEQEAQRRRQEVEEQGKSRQAEALFGTYERIRQEDPGLAEEAEAAARMGSMSRLQELLASMPQRRALRQAGVDPDDPMAVTNYEREQKIEDEIGKSRRLKEAELEMLPEELKIRDESEDAQMRKRLGLEHHYWTLQEAQRAARAKTGEGAARRIRLDSGTGKWMQEDPETGVWSPIPGFKGGFKPQTVNIDGVPHKWDPAVGVAVPIKTQDQVEEERREAAEAAERKARRAREGPGYLERVGAQIKGALSLPPARPPADVGKKPIVSAPTAKRVAPIQKAPPAPHVLQEPGTAPTGAGGRVTTAPEKKASPLRGKPKPAEEAMKRGDATAKLATVADPATRQKIALARENGHSDEDIARFLGLM